jgi:hypothetical protein
MDPENGSSEPTMKPSGQVLLRIELADNFEIKFPGWVEGDEKLIPRPLYKTEPALH